MALSGSKYVNVSKHNRLQIEWTATQNISANQSTVTAKLYWMAIDQYGYVNSSATKSGYIDIEGSRSSFSGAGLAQLSGNQKKLIHTYSKTITHNADGTFPDLDITGSFTPAVTLAGTYVGTVSVTDSWALNTIPRASTVKSEVSWVAGRDNLAISVNSASSSFRHQALIYIQRPSDNTWQYIGETDANNKFATSTTMVFNSTHVKRMYENITPWEVRSAKITLKTYNGTTLIGTSEKTGQVTALPRGTVSFSDFNIGDDISATIGSWQDIFTYNVKFVFGNFSKTFSNLTSANVTFTFTDDEIQDMYAQIPNANKGVGTAFVSTYYQGVLTNEEVGKQFYANVVGSNPTFTTYTYKDDNTETVNITGNNQYIVQNKSTVLVEIPVNNRAVAKNKATMDRYEATLNGKTIKVYLKDVADTDVIKFDFDTINASQDLTLIVRAIDSRGNITPVSKTVKMLQYANPTANAKASRLNNFENSTTLTVTGAYSPLKIGTANMNAISSSQYRYKPKGATTWTLDWTDFEVLFNPDTGTYSVTSVTLDLDNQQEWTIEVHIDDAIETKSTTLTVAVGVPVFFIDWEKKSISINMFPNKSSAFQIAGDLEGKTLRLTGTGDVSPTSTTHPFQIGLDTGLNVRMDVNEFQAVNNGIVSALHLNTEGGDVTMFNNTSYALKFSNGFIVQEDVIAPSLQNAWINYGSGYVTAGYWKDKNGVVHIQGLIKAGTTANGTVIFTLPTGYRPSGTEIFHVPSAGSVSNTSNPSRIDVKADGTVVVQGLGDAGWMSLAGISFRAV